MKLQRIVSSLLPIALCIGLAAGAQAEKWNVDKSHTNVGFSVSHLFTSVHGRFDSFDGTIEFDPDDPSKALVKGEIEAASIDTNNEKRDKHLRSADFFDVEKFPKLTFVSVGGIRNMQGKSGELPGKLTLHGVTKDVVIAVEYLGTAKDPWGNTRAGFRGTLKLNRKDYGLNWNEVLETGGLLVGDEVEIRIDAQGVLAE